MKMDAVSPVDPPCVLGPVSIGAGFRWRIAGAGQGYNPAVVPVPGSIPPVVRFGGFEAALGTGELRRKGVRVALQEQPFQVLAMLLERPGALVTRDELHARIWPEAVFVDFEHGLNKAVSK